MPTTCAPRSLCLTAKLQDLAHIRRFVQESAVSFGLAPEYLPAVLLAADEAATNVILHGYSGKSGPLEIEVSRLPDALMIRLRDEAAPFDPTRMVAPDTNAPLEQRTPGGLGLYFIAQAMDDITYRRLPSGENELTLLKRVS